MNSDVKYSIDERDIFLRGEHVYLKGLTENDIFLTNWYGWFNDEETTKDMQKHYFPNNMDTQLEYLNGNKNNRNKLHLGIVCKEDRKLIGTISLDPINYINSNAEMNIIIGEPGYRKIIYSEEAVKLIIEFGFFTLNLKRVYAGGLSIEWITFLKKRFGFKEEGVFRKHVFKNGEYVDVYNIGILGEEYLEFMKARKGK